MSSEAQKRASVNYNRKQDNIMIRPSKEEGAAIRAAAAAANKSVQGYVLEAVREKMGKESTITAQIGGSPSPDVPTQVPQDDKQVRETMPAWGTKEYFEMIKAEDRRRQQAQQQGEPEIGSAAWWAQRAPQGTKAEDDTPGDIPIF